MAPDGALDLEMELAALGFAARLLYSELDRETMIERALEGMADLSKSSRLAMFLMEPTDEAFNTTASLVDNQLKIQAGEVPLTGTMAAKALETKKPALYPLTLREGLPWPGEAPHPEARQCLCAPLVGSNNNVVGLVTIEMSGDAILDAGSSLPLLVFVAVTAIGLEVSRMFRLAVTDSLTGLYVRRYFDLRLEEEMARVQRYGGCMALMMVDLDHFKRVNDVHGHQTGDEVLKAAAAILSDTIRAKVDLVCRYGGEEFVLVLPNTDHQGAHGLARRLREAFSKKEFNGTNGDGFKVTFSGGIAWTEQGQHLTAEELISRADQALYRAKEEGRDRVYDWQG